MVERERSWNRKVLVNCRWLLLVRCEGKVTYTAGLTGCGQLAELLCVAKLD